MGGTDNGIGSIFIIGFVCFVTGTVGYIGFE
jgi:hypothetical protein